MLHIFTFSLTYHCRYGNMFLLENTSLKGKHMANYDYVALDELNKIMHSTDILDGITIKSTRGKTCNVKLETWKCNNGEEHTVIKVSNNHRSGGVWDNDNDGGITFGHFVFEVLLSMNCRLKTNDGKYRELNINRDMWYANNPKSELFGKLVDVTTGAVIA